MMLAQQMFRDWFFGGPPMRTPESIATSSDALFLGIWWLSVFFFVLLMVLMVYFAIRYRRRPGVAPERSPSHNTALELTWSVVPTLLLVVIFFWGFWGYMHMHVAPGDSEQASLVARKWNWELTYDNGAVPTQTKPLGAKAGVPVFYLPDDRPLQLRMVSMDVLHSFWVPAMRKKLDVFPNRYTSYWVQSDEIDWDNDPEVTFDEEAGVLHKDYYIFCAEYCGDQHSEMAAILRVVDGAWFDEWKKSAALPEEPVERGEVLYKVRGCNQCHSVDGSSGTGPTWKNLYGSTSEYQDGSTAVMDANQIRESIYNPAAQIRAGYDNQMNSYQGQIDERDMSAIIAFMESISEHAQGDGDSASEEGN